MKIANKLKVFAVAMAMMVSGVAAVAPAMAAGSCPAGSVNATYDKSIAECNVAKDESGRGLTDMFKTIINVVLALIGAIAVVMLILGGVQYSTSSGDAARVKKAKDTILYGIIGLVIALLAFAIVNFILGAIFA